MAGDGGTGTALEPAGWNCSRNQAFRAGRMPIGRGDAVLPAEAQSLGQSADSRAPGQQRSTPLFEPGANVWRVELAGRFSVLIDGAAFFAAVRQAALKAQRSIFIMGWDLDSRTRLVGESGKPEDRLSCRTCGLSQCPGGRAAGAQCLSAALGLFVPVCDGARGISVALPAMEDAAAGTFQSRQPSAARAPRSIRRSSSSMIASRSPAGST